MNRFFLVLAGLALIFSACSSDYRHVLDADDSGTVSNGVSIKDNACMVRSNEIGNQADFNAFGTPFLGAVAYLDEAKTIWLEKNGNETYLTFGEMPTVGLVKIAVKDGNNFIIFSWDTSRECARNTVVFFDGRQYSNIRYRFEDAENPDEPDEPDDDDGQIYDPDDLSGVYIVGGWYEPVFGMTKSSVGSGNFMSGICGVTALRTGNSLHLLSRENTQHIKSSTDIDRGVRVAKLWKDGNIQTLSNKQFSYATSVFVTDNDVYAGGIESVGRGNAAIWKNGKLQNLTPSVPFYVEVSSIFVSNGNVYAVGSENHEINIAKLWINGVEQNLGSAETWTWAVSVFVSDGDVYVAGMELPHERVPGGGLTIVSGIAIAKLWVNGKEQNLTDGRLNAWATSVFVSDGDVYVAGMEGINPRLWKNGVVQNINSEGTFLSSVFVSDGDVFVAGYDHYGRHSKIWKNGKLLYQMNGKYYINSIFVSGDDVYAAGNEDQPFLWNVFPVAKFWKNGVIHDISYGSVASFATCIFVK